MTYAMGDLLEKAMPVHRVGVKWEQHRVREQLGDC